MNPAGPSVSAKRRIQLAASKSSSVASAGKWTPSRESTGPDGVAGAVDDRRVSLAVSPCHGAVVAASGGSGTAGDGGADAVCVGISTDVDPGLTSLLLLVERGDAMAERSPGVATTRWEAVAAAVEAFSQSPEANWARLGVVFSGQEGTDDVARECEPDLAGYDWLAVVLVGTGVPTMCADREPTTIADAIATSRASDAAIRTVAIGVGQSSLTALDAYAEAGSDTLALVPSDGALEVEVASALASLTVPSIRCAHEIPEPPAGSQIDLASTQVEFDPGWGPPESILRVDGPGDCAAGGWYYDDADLPTQVLLCPCSCVAARTGRLDLLFGCIAEA